MLHTLLFLCMYFLGFVLAITTNPAVSFALYEAVYFFYPSDRWWGTNVPDISYSFYTVILMLGMLARELAKGSAQPRLLSAPQFRWTYFLLFLYGIAWFYAVSPDEHFEAFIYYLKLVVIVSVAFKLVDTTRKLDLCLWGYIFGSWYVSVLVYQTGRDRFGRVEGIGTVDSPDANGIAAAIAPSLVACLYYFWTKSNKLHKLIFAFAGVFIANALILINSRGSFLAAAISIVFFVYYMFFSSLQRKSQKMIAVIIAVAGIAGFVYLADDTFFARVQTMQNVEVNKEQQTGATRLVFWASAWELAKDRPFGSGFQGFNFYAPEYLPEDVDTGSRNRSVHSSWFEVLSEVGYLGLLIFMM
ncbi:MAG: O-antigen ligase family protein [Calditrichaeota bacterium]|nr:O-antigen ligase family protein [Calditrichota bacterium]